MYDVAAFREDRVEVLHALMRAHPLATLVTLGAEGLEANHIPLLIDAEPAPFGTLRGHVARANPVWQLLSTDTPVLAVFQGAQGYITPSWYASKSEHGKVVPTWNYAAVHAQGVVCVRHETDWLRTLVTRLTENHEAQRAEPWQVSDAPAVYLDGMLKAIVGIEIRLTRLQGKWKMSQNRLPKDQASVVQALRNQDDGASRALLDAMRK